MTVLALIPVITFGLCYFARRNPDSQATRIQNRVLAAILLSSYPVKIWSGHIAGWPATPLPMHLCDWVAVLCGLALILRKRWMAELAWFWGITGTVQGLVTPMLAHAFPHPRFFAFFQLHAGVVICTFYLVWGLRLTPRPGSVWRAFGALQIYTLAAILINLLTGQNYGFLCHKPDATSLLTYLGPWPVYILTLEALALLLFTLLYLPFRTIDRETNRGSKSEPGES